MSQKLENSFCAAKWLQVTIYLQNGVNHSCHHPNTHRIPLEEIKENISAFNNTKFKKSMRAQMLNGERPSECQYCWNIEDSVGREHSDRNIKNNDSWASPKIDKITSSSPDLNVEPTYLEVSLGSECNFACSYCKADSSSRILNELNKFGDYQTLDEYGKLSWLRADGRIPVYGEDNPYQESFLLWLRTIIDNLSVFRLTGGEPFLSPIYDEVLSIVKERKASGLEFSINSNLGINEKLLKAKIDDLQLLHPLIDEKNITIYTSMEAFGRQAEYIRFGLDIRKFQNNVRYILSNTDYKLVFMVTYNILSLYSFEEFLEFVLELKNEYEGKHTYGQRVILDTSYLASPSYMSIKFCTNEQLEKIKSNLDFIEKNSIKNLGNYGFSEYEISKFKRIYLWRKSLKNSEEQDQVVRARYDFYTFFSEFDKRKGLCFEMVFPEMKQYYHYCRLVKNDIEFQNRKRQK